MDQEKLAELVRLIMADPRLMELINGPAKQSGDLTLIESRAVYDSLPLEWRSNVFCQELRDGSDGFLSYDATAAGQWKQIRVYQPSLNFIAKLATGVADEPILQLLQERISEGTDSIELARLCSLSKIKSDSYRRLFNGHLETIRSFGVLVDAGIPVQADGKLDKAGGNPATICPETGTSILWQYKALTEKDLLDMKKGTVLKVGKKCIVTSLAADMVKRKSIQICREGEVK
jgi:hypothetical protein